MIVAELEVYHSRPVAPTRRVALGYLNLPIDPPPGFGGVLLGGIVARHVGALDPDLLPDLQRLTLQLENGLSIPQPRLRYRFQRDTVGLQRSTHRLLGEGDVLLYSFDDREGAPSQQVLGAVYAAGQLPLRARGPVMGAIRRAIGWQGPVGSELIAALAGFRTGSSWSAQALGRPVEWALGVLGFDPAGAPSATRLNGFNGRNGNGRTRTGATGGPTANGAGGNGTGGNGPGANGSTVNGSEGKGFEGKGPESNGHPHVSRSGDGPSRRQIQQRYRRLLIEAHPDHGGRSESAAQRIADLTEARRILLG